MTDEELGKIRSMLSGPGLDDNPIVQAGLDRVRDGHDLGDVLVSTIRDLATALRLAEDHLVVYRIQVMKKMTTTFADVGKALRQANEAADAGGFKVGDKVTVTKISCHCADCMFINGGPYAIVRQTAREDPALAAGPTTWTHAPGSHKARPSNFRTALVRLASRHGRIVNCCFSVTNLAHYTPRGS